MCLLEQCGAVADYGDPDAEFLDGWAGLSAMPLDGHQIIDETCPGLGDAVGFSGHRLMQTPAVGTAIAKLVLDGAASTVDASDLTADRFGDENTLAEHTML